MSISVASAGPSNTHRADVEKDEDVQMVDSAGEPVSEAQATGGGEDGEEGDEEGEGDDEYEIEHIVSHSDVMIDDQMSYFVKWKGYPDSENSWVFESDMGGAQEMIQEYWAKLPKKTLKKMGTKAGTKKGKRTSSLGAAVSSPAAKESNRRRTARESSLRGTSHTATTDSPSTTRRGGGGTPTTTTPGRGAPGRFEPQPSTSPSPEPSAEIQISDTDPVIFRIRSDVSLSEDQKQVLEQQHLQALKIDRMRKKYAKIPDWDPIVSKIESIEKMHSNKIRFFVKFESGDRLAFENTVCHHRCPLKVIEFYESHLRFKDSNTRTEETLRGDQDTNELEAWKQKQAEEEQVKMQNTAAVLDPQEHVNGDANGTDETTIVNGTVETGQAEGTMEGQEDTQTAPKVDASAEVEAEGEGEGEADETQETFQDAPAATGDEESQAEDMPTAAATTAAGLADEGETSAAAPAELDGSTTETAAETERGADESMNVDAEGSHLQQDDAEEELDASQVFEQIDQGDEMQQTAETTD